MFSESRALSHPGVRREVGQTQVSVLGKIPDMFPGQPVTSFIRDQFFFIVVFFLVTIMVFLVSEVNSGSFLSLV